MELSPDAVIADRYIVRSPLGEGAFGAVWLVEDATTHELRALKFLKVAEAGSRERLQREGRAQASFDEPHIVKVLDILQLETGPALVMELVQGPSLADLLHQRPLEPVEVGVVGEGVLRGLLAAHRRGLVHRDLKPSNILLAGEAPFWLAKISDFGLLKDLEAEQGLTGVGLGMGSPGYMAPEQYTDARSVDHRADVFSAGAVLFEIMVGRRAFQGGTVPEQFRAAIECAYPPPERLAPGHPAGRYAAVRSALVAEIDQRAQDVETLLQLWTAREEGTSELSQTFALSGVYALEAIEATGAAIAAAAQEPASTVVLEPSAAPAAVLVPMAGNLPSRTTTFLGRRAERERLDRLLSEGRRLITIVGPAGSGKSALAVNHAQRRRTLPSAARWLADCANAQTPEEVCAIVAAVLDVSLTQEDGATQVGEALRGRGVLVLILDNLEQAARCAGPLLKGWLAQAPELRLIATSRLALRAQGEQLFPVEPLSVPKVGGEALALVQAYPSVQLFVARARLVKPSFDLTPQNTDDIAAIVRELDGLPLAIELAAARVRMMSLRTILQRLNRRFDLLGGRRDGEHTRGSTLRGALDGSWELLRDEERRGLLQCSVFGGPFPLAGVELVIEASGESDVWAIDIVEALVDHSLLRQVPGEDGDRFELLSTVRAYAQEILATLPEDKERYEALHGEFYAEIAAPERLALLEGVQGSAVLHSLLSNRENLRIAAGRALRRGTRDVAVPTVRALVAVAELHGPVGPTLALLVRARALPELSPRDNGWLLYDRARLHLAAGRPSDAEDDLLAVIEQAEELSDSPLMADALRRSGVAARRRSKLERAGALASRARELHVALGDAPAAAVDLNLVANVAFARGAHAEAADGYERALSELRSVANRRELGVTLGNLGTTRMVRGDQEGARTAFVEALAALSETGHRRGESIHRMSLGMLERRAGRLAEAAEHFERALETTRHMGDPRLEGRALAGGAQVALEQGKLEEARAGYEAAVALHEASRNTRSRALAVGNLGEVLLRLGLAEEAATHLREGASECAAMGMSAPSGAFLGGLAEAEATLGDDAAARRNFLRAEHLLALADEPVERGKLLVRRGRFHRSRGEREAALGDLASVDAILAETGDVELTGVAEALRAELL